MREFATLPRNIKKKCGSYFQNLKSWGCELTWDPGAVEGRGLEVGLGDVLEGELGAFAPVPREGGREEDDEEEDQPEDGDDDQEGDADPPPVPLVRRHRYQLLQPQNHHQLDVFLSNRTVSRWEIWGVLVEAG